MKPAILCAALLTSVAQAATLPDALLAEPTAVAAIDGASYCFARVRGLDPGRQPQAYLVLRLHVRVVYRNPGERPLLVPLERERVVFTSLKPGPMTVFHEPVSLFDQAYQTMNHLPADVNPDNPVSPANDVFNVIPARGEMVPPLFEDITMPVDRQTMFGHNPDLRGHRVYLLLQFTERRLSPVLDAVLSDRWAQFGVPWSGTLRTNTFAIDVPASPKGEPCNDSHAAGHP